MQDTDLQYKSHEKLTIACDIKTPKYNKKDNIGIKYKSI